MTNEAKIFMMSVLLRSNKDGSLRRQRFGEQWAIAAL
jgi:hypothetical protein